MLVRYCILMMIVTSESVKIRVGVSVLIKKCTFCRFGYDNFKDNEEGESESGEDDHKGLSV